jgi:hypothetical protein
MDFVYGPIVAVYTLIFDVFHRNRAKLTSEPPAFFQYVFPFRTLSYEPIAAKPNERSRPVLR